MWSCFEALESTKISSYEPLSSQTYENGYWTKICDFTVGRGKGSKKKKKKKKNAERRVFLSSPSSLFWKSMQDFRQFFAHFSFVCAGMVSGKAMNQPIARQSRTMIY